MAIASAYQKNLVLWPNSFATGQFGQSVGAICPQIKSSNGNLIITVPMLNNLAVLILMDQLVSLARQTPVHL
jgi:hypothetical protein